mmetsp:Transcript_21528/g.74128  ORF Transcript_21528/g.74128 Transcript_21528/m.74128 type:complete len:219 (+) Transcript_21528:353-1009(+)
MPSCECHGSGSSNAATPCGRWQRCRRGARPHRRRPVTAPSASEKRQGSARTLQHQFYAGAPPSAAPGCARPCSRGGHRATGWSTRASASGGTTFLNRQSQRRASGGRLRALCRSAGTRACVRRTYPSTAAAAARSPRAQTSTPRLSASQPPKHGHNRLHTPAPQRRRLKQPRCAARRQRKRAARQSWRAARQLAEPRGLVGAARKGSPPSTRASSFPR